MPIFSVRVCFEGAIEVHYAAHNHYGLTTYDISASILFELLVLDALWIMLNVPSIGLSTPFLGKLVESLQMRYTANKTKCFPFLYYGLEACPLRKSQFSCLIFFK